MYQYMLTILSFSAGVTVVAGVYSIVSDLYLRDKERVKDRIDEEFRNKQRIRVQQSPLFKDLGQLAADVRANGDDEAPGIRQRFETMIEQSGLDLTPRSLLLISLGSSIALAMVSVLLGKGLLLGCILAPIGFVIPLIYVRQQRRARLEKLLSQLPDTFDLMSRVIRAGQTISQSLQAVADEFPQPIASEFGYCFEQQNLGLSVEISMRDLARRTGLLEIQIFVMALLVQQQAGGNLAEMLDKLATIIRARYKLLGQVKALTAEGRMQAIVLLALPPIIFIVMFILNKEYVLTLFEYPRLLWASIACEGIGALWIRKIVNFDF